MGLQVPPSRREEGVGFKALAGPEVVGSCTASGFPALSRSQFANVPVVPNAAPGVGRGEGERVCCSRRLPASPCLKISVQYSGTGQAVVL